MTKTTKTLPEIYREAAELVLAEGKVENEMKSIGDDDQCFGYCTMGAVFEVTGNLNEFGEVLEEFDGTDEETRLIEPVADQLDASGRYKKVRYSEENFSSWMTIAEWNDQEENKPTAQDVAALLRETADAVEEVSV
jgi:hypothetical protein